MGLSASGAAQPTSFITAGLTQAGLPPAARPASIKSRSSVRRSPHRLVKRLDDGSGPTQGAETHWPDGSPAFRHQVGSHTNLGGIAVNLKFTRSHDGTFVPKLVTCQHLPGARRLRGGRYCRFRPTTLLRTAGLSYTGEPGHAIGGYSDYFVAPFAGDADEIVMRTEHE